MCVEFRQATSPGGQIEYTEEESGTILSGGTKGRICRVELDGMLFRGMAGGCLFPSVGAGFLPRARTKREKDGLMLDEETIPVFATKKMAKQYAAKCAVEWLIKRGRMPENIQAKVERRVAKDEDDAEVVAGATTSVGSVEFPPQGDPDPEDSPEAQMMREMEEGETYIDDKGRKRTDHPNGVTTIHPPSPHPPPKKRSVAPFPPDHTAVQYPIEPISASSTTATTVAAADPTQVLPTAVPTNARELVATLCQKLGFPPPRYVITPPIADEHSEGESANGKPLFMFDGHPEFANGDNDEELICLREYARLTGVRAEGQETMKNVVAGKLLARLREIEAERRAQLEALMKR